MYTKRDSGIVREVGGAVAPGGSMMQGVAKLIFKVKK